ncbi:TetR/AcrR family transcriptional regulator, partial [Pseudomonas aeruginosa]
MARKPRAEMIEETRAKLIDAARRAFADNGYAGASMDELTASAGLTRGALYHHFGDKKGLLAAVVQQIDDEMNLRLGAILAAGEDLWSGFRAYNRAYRAMDMGAEIQHNGTVSYTNIRNHETERNRVCRLSHQNKTMPQVSR